MLVDLTGPPDNWSSFSFPDGQQHVSTRLTGATAFGVRRGELRARITDGDELLRVLLAADSMRRNGVEAIDLTIAYLTGARMDRPMPRDDNGVHPFTLQVVANVLASEKFASVQIFDPHSDVAPALLRARTILPLRQVAAVLEQMPQDVVVVVPDAGASKRTDAILSALALPRPLTTVQAVKKRNPATGNLSGFDLVGTDHQLAGKLIDRRALIVDDLIDGGRTFSEVARLLRDHGAENVDLYVSHGIFSKGFAIDNVDRIFTTDSYRSFDGVPDHVTVMSWGW